jgi:hypothetical protein
MKDPTERMAEFGHILKMSSDFIPPQEDSVEKILSNTFEAIEKLLLLAEKAFNKATNSGEVTLLAFHIRQLQKYEKELKGNKYALYIVFPYVVGLSQALSIYKSDFGLN